MSNLPYLTCVFQLSVIESPVPFTELHPSVDLPAGAYFACSDVIQFPKLHLANKSDKPRGDPGMTDVAVSDSRVEIE